MSDRWSDALMVREQVRKLWAWENSWLIYSVIGLLCIPIASALILIPDLVAVYRAAGPEAVALAMLFGFGWGVGSVLFGSCRPVQHPGAAQNAIWALAVGAGSLANIGYSLWLLFRNKSWSGFKIARSGLAALRLNLVGVALLIAAIAVISVGSAR